MYYCNGDAGLILEIKLHKAHKDGFREYEVLKVFYHRNKSMYPKVGELNGFMVAFMKEEKTEIIEFIFERLSKYYN